MSSIPKSKKLAEETASDEAKAPRSVHMAAAMPLDDVIVIKPVQCLNENVAVLCFRTDVGGGLVLPEEEGFKEEGMVVGTGMGVPDGAGGRTKSQLELGDIVTFQQKQILRRIKPENGPYKDQLVLIINERSLMTKLPPRPFKVLEEDA
jgi:co-chaperonin GroES (HSP10)